MIQGAVISVLGFFALWGLAFFVNLVLAPGRIDAEQQKSLNDSVAVIAELQQTLAAPKVSTAEKVQRDLLKEKLQYFSKEEKAVLEYIRQHGETDRDAIVKRFGFDVADNGVRKGVEHGLLFQGRGYSYAVKPEFLDALLFYFHGE
jgi:acetylornithine deacetylase/succinyl-diaminopimelate desuccinylase-like protein